MGQPKAPEPAPPPSSWDSPPWLVAAGEPARGSGSGRWRGGCWPTAWQSPARQRQGTWIPSSPWAPRGWPGLGLLPGPCLDRSPVWGVGWAPGEALGQCAGCLSALVKSSTRVPRPGVTHMAVIPAPVTGRARNSRSQQAAGQLRMSGQGCAESWPRSLIQTCSSAVGRPSPLLPQGPIAISLLGS